MGIRLEPGDKDKKPVEIRVGKGLNPGKPSVPSDRSSDPSRVPEMDYKGGSTCDECGGDSRLDGRAPTRKVMAGKTETKCYKCVRKSREAKRGKF